MHAETQSDDAIVTKDLNGIITSWNNGAERVFGYTAEEAVGQSVTMLIPSEHIDEEPAILARIGRGERIDHYETVRVRKDGTQIDISLTVSLIKDASGKIIGASKVARDVSDRRRAEKQISYLAREAEHRAKNIFSTVQAALHLTRADNLADFRKAVEGRIQALAIAHRLFVESRWAGAELSALVSEELMPYRRGDGTRVNVDGPQVLLEPSIAQILAVAVHELATNAAKYGALSVGEGHVAIAWTILADGRLV